MSQEYRSENEKTLRLNSQHLGLVVVLLVGLQSLRHLDLLLVTYIVIVTRPVHCDSHAAMPSVTGTNQQDQAAAGTSHWHDLAASWHCSVEMLVDFALLCWL